MQWVRVGSARRSQRIGHGLCAGLLLGLLVTTGCAPGPAGEEHEGLAHVIPAHKPTGLPHAVEELERRWQALEAAGPAAEERQWVEITDIVNWIPELTADTDLQRPTWEKAQQAARACAQILLDARGGRATELSSNWDTQLQVLREIAALPHRSYVFDLPAAVGTASNATDETADDVTGDTAGEPVSVPREPAAGDVPQAGAP